jgi:hypothetical protein
MLRRFAAAMILVMAINMDVTNVFGQAVMVGQQTWFDSWVFGNQSQAEFKKSQISKAVLEVRQMETYTSITDEQKEKLLLSAQGDIARFMRMAEKAREKTTGMQPDQENIQKIQEIISPIQMKVQSGILDKDSLFQLQMKQILSEEQLAAIKEGTDKRKSQMLSVSVRLILSKLEYRMPMTQKQRTELTTLIETTLAGKKVPLQYQAYAASCVLMVLPEDKLKEILDEHQIKVIKSDDANLQGIMSYLESVGVKLK